MYVGTPLQGLTTNMISYDTATYASLIPSSGCSSCPNKWYTEDDSSTFDNTNMESYELDLNHWVGQCNNVTDTVCLANDNTTTCATALEFCLISFEVSSPYAFSGALGLGLPMSDYSDGPDPSSFVEVWATE